MERACLADTAGPPGPRGNTTARRRISPGWSLVIMFSLLASPRAIGPQHGRTARLFLRAGPGVQANGDGRPGWVAAQLPMQWQPGGPWRISVRPEVAWDSIGRWTLAEQTVTALTTTLEYRTAAKSVGTSLRFEHRVDRSTGPQGGFFTDRESATGNPALTPTQHLAIAALVLRFDGSR